MHSKYKTKLLILVILVSITVLAIICCSVLSRRYINPIMDNIECLKQGTINKQNQNIPEIVDLFDFFEQQNKEYEQKLSNLEKQKRLTEQEATKIQSEIVDLLDFFEQNNREYEQKLSNLEEQKRLAEQEAIKIQSELDRIIDERKNELNDDSINHFLGNLITLTPREKAVFNLYLEGYSGKEIVEKLGFTNNTLKFHNKNIYAKLGVTSRKELMQYAVILKQRNRNE